MKNISKIAIFIWTVILCSSCEPNPTKENGVLKGKISIGPICPVETIPPNPACLPTQETYKYWAVYVWTLDKKEKIAQLQPELDGNYSLQLAVGRYILDLDDQHRFGKNLPASIIIKNNETTIFDVNIDTGIR
ncbi:hypothetical protein [Flavobacterium faecale]|uniref:hypothetical protein n=1 Tax=Flavobacterium faecale TaxID=1355330 RepID=UPI003AAC03F6